jgi:head-tail adaptor
MAHVPHGMMRLVATLQNPATTVDDLGQAVETWSDVAVIPMHIEQLDTAESVDDGGPAIQSNYRILCPWHPSISTRSRLLWSDGGTTRYLNIRGATDRDQRRRNMEIIAVEVVL